MIKNFLNKISNRTRLGFFAALFLLFLSYILTYISTRKVIIQDYWINHTNEVIHGLDNINGFINQAESAFRGYLLSNDKKNLLVYDQSIRKTDSSFDKLRLFTKDNKVQQKNLDTLHYLIDQKFLWIEDVISQYSHTNKAAPFFLNESELNLTSTNDIGSEIIKMKAEGKTAWVKRSKMASEYSGLIDILNIISIIIAALLTFYSLLVYNKENKAKQKASKKADQYRAQLQSRVQQLAELNTELIELRSQEKYAVTGRIARVIAHEVRNPLTNINLATEQLKSEMEGAQNSDMLFTMIARNSERINQLVSDLLSSTRVTELTFSKVPINHVLDESLQLAKDRIALNQIQVIKNYDTEICPISIDVDKVKIAFLNIIINAIEAMDRNGILEITTSKKESRCIVKISDNGRGMSKEETARLFEPYFTTKEKGNGLGLANTQNIILGHKGSISAESEPGRGTMFTITFII
ncbi:MAG TPA: ATP-binding protein [Hanamia sp.]|nr:ATP-binding protein [Hanamia sp.]